MKENNPDVDVIEEWDLSDRALPALNIINLKEKTAIAKVFNLEACEVKSTSVDLSTGKQGEIKTESFDPDILTAHFLTIEEQPTEKKRKVYMSLLNSEKPKFDMSKVKISKIPGGIN